MREAGEEIARRGGSASWHRADVRSAEDVEGLFRAVVERHGGIDVLVAAAGIARRTRFAELTWEEWRETFAVNVDGVFRYCQAALEPMRKWGRGAIVVIGSVAGWTGGMKGLAGMAQQVPLGRLGGPPDLVGAAVYLASPASGYVTGTVLTVDGGLTVG